VGLQICYDKAFPEAARIMALKRAQIIASLSAWPAARTATAENLQDDRWTYRFNLFDAARALDNQVFWIASNQSGTFGSLRYVGNAKVVDPGGNTLATTLLGSGMAVADVDIDGTFRAMRAGMFHLRDRRPDVYGPVAEPTGSDLAHA
jgi:predicted amidohydrolase